MGNFWVVPLLHSVSDMITKQVKIKKTTTFGLYFLSAAVKKENSKPQLLTSRNSYRPLTKRFN
jgi:hypothetical protein